MINSDEFRALPRDIAENFGFRYIVEDYMDNYLGLAIPASQEQLWHAANATVQGIHVVFPANDVDDDDPISLKKVRKGEGRGFCKRTFWGSPLMAKQKPSGSKSPSRMHF